MLHGAEDAGCLSFEAFDCQLGLTGFKSKEKT